MSPIEPDAAPKARRGRPPSGGREAILASALDLLRERGASRLTTREVATRAGVSEGSVFYHFNDRSGLLTAVIEDGLAVLALFHGPGPDSGGVGGDAAGEPEPVIEHFLHSLDPFLDRALTVMIAAQSDAELRTGMAEFLLKNNFGPHRGIEAMARYLSALQARGDIRADVDATTVAMLLIGSSFLRSAQKQMISVEYGESMPGPDAIAKTVAILLTPPDGSG